MARGRPRDRRPTSRADRRDPLVAPLGGSPRSARLGNAAKSAGLARAGVERFGLLSAAGSTPKSRVRDARVMGQKEDAVKAVGFHGLSIFRPGIIAGNVNTPGYVSALGRLVPGSFGTIEQDDIGRAFVAALSQGAPGVTVLDNGAMRKLARA